MFNVYQHILHTVHIVPLYGAVI